MKKWKVCSKKEKVKKEKVHRNTRESEKVESVQQNTRESGKGKSAAKI